MKKSLWIFATIALFFTGDRLAGLLLEKVTFGSLFRYSRMYAGQAQSDILLVGNSRGLIFYQPEIEKITGKKTFNLSYNGMPIDLAKALVMDYLERYEAPEELIIDISMCDRMNPSLINGFQLYTPYSERLETLLLQTDKFACRAAQLSHLYRYNSEIFQRALFYLRKNDEDWLLDRVINQHLINHVTEEKEITFGLDDQKKDYLPEMIQQLTALVQAARHKDVKVVLVINPYYPPFVNKVANLHELKRKVEAATGLPVYDYSTAVQEEAGFADYQHLNKYGATLFLKQLKEDGLF